MPKLRKKVLEHTSGPNVDYKIFSNSRSKRKNGHAFDPTTILRHSCQKFGPYKKRSANSPI